VSGLVLKVDLWYFYDTTFIRKWYHKGNHIRWDVGSETTCDLLLYFNLPLSRIVFYDILLAGNRIKVDFFTSFFLILPVYRPLTVEWA